MINSDIFDYVNVLDKAADGAWLRNEAISNNIANVNTPNYKRQDVSFEEELKNALKANRYETLDQKVADMNLDTITPRTYTDSSEYSYRMDGNNVDIQTENVELASNEIKYNALIQSISGKFSSLSMVMK
jgi:flagellar basal-body rod protein FlgB